MTIPVDIREDENPSGDPVEETEPKDLVLEREALEEATQALHRLLGELHPDATQKQRFEACAERMVVAATEYGHAAAFVEVRDAMNDLREQLNERNELVGARAARLAAGAAGVRVQGAERRYS